MYSSSETAALNAALGFLGTFWLLLVAFLVLNIVANWKIFTKAGQAGWASIIPFYNTSTLSSRFTGAMAGSSWFPLF